MLRVLAQSWALLLGMLLLMIGNGMQGTLLGVRGGIEEFSTIEMSMVMSAYFGGFLFASRMAPEMIRRVGHVRVFAALASFISAVLILYPTFAHPITWIIGRAVIGFCFCGVYITAESWLNNNADNDTRGQALSLYMIVQTLGIVVAQGLINVADPAGFELFIIPSILVSIAVAPILLSVSPTPAFEATKPMKLKTLIASSPLGCAGMFLLGGVFSAQFGMSSVYGDKAGLSVAEISTFTAMFYVSATIVQYPLGWISDRMDRRVIIMVVSLIAGLGGLIGLFWGQHFAMLLVSAALIGGLTNPLYSLLIAHTNDYIDYEDMAAASAGLLFINGLGAISGPLITGYLMDDAIFGAGGYFILMSVLLFTLAAYASYRMTQRKSVPIDEFSPYAAMFPTASPVAVEAAQEVANDPSRTAGE